MPERKRVAERSEWQQRALEAGRLFTPAAPISAEAFFAGRIGQLRRVVDAVNQRGQHAMIFGERGVGKTSMANVVATKILGPVLPVRVNCDTTDTYSSLWMKVFERTPVEQTVTDMGLMSTTTTVHEFLADRFRDDEGGGIVPDDVCRALEGLRWCPVRS